MSDKKVTVGELHAAYQTLASVARENDKMPSKAAYWIARMLKRLEPEFLPAEQTRVKLIRELGEEANGSWSVTNGNIPEFNEKWSAICKVESDLVPIKVKLETLDGVEMTPQQMMVLEPFIEE